MPVNLYNLKFSPLPGDFERVELIYGLVDSYKVTETDIWWGPNWTHFNTALPDSRRMITEERHFPYYTDNYQPNAVKMNDIKVRMFWCIENIVYGIGLLCNGECNFENCPGNVYHTFRLEFFNSHIRYLDIRENLLSELLSRRHVFFESYQRELPQY